MRYIFGSCSASGAGAGAGVSSGVGVQVGILLAEFAIGRGVIVGKSPGGMFAITIVLVGVVLSPAVGTGFFRIVAGFDAGQGVVNHFACAIFGGPRTEASHTLARCASSAVNTEDSKSCLSRCR